MKEEILELLNSINIEDRVLAIRILYETVGAEEIRKIFPDAYNRQDKYFGIPEIQSTRDIYFKDINILILTDNILYYPYNARPGEISETHKIIRYD